MIKIAVLLTSHNRKEKTLNCLESLFKAVKSVNYNLKIDVYLTDDASNDGTSIAVNRDYPNVIVIKGNGSLFWAGGMRKAWTESLKCDYKGYLLLNDDTFLLDNVFVEIMKTEIYSLNEFNKKGIYVGSTKDDASNLLTYGGAKLLNVIFLKYKKIIPSDIPQICDLGNANIMYVSSDVVEQIGIIHDEFIHGYADFDYTLKAIKNNIPVLVMPNYCGICKNDHENKYIKFSYLNFRERLTYLHSPTGLAFSDSKTFMKRNFIFRWPFVIIAGYIKLLFPRTYLNIQYLIKSINL